MYRSLHFGGKKKSDWFKNLMCIVCLGLRKTLLFIECYEIMIIQKYYLWWPKRDFYGSKAYL